MTSDASHEPRELLPPKEWAERYRSIEDRPFNLTNYRPLWEPYNDDHPDQVYLKCAQIGASEMMISKAVHALDQGADFYGTSKAGLNVGYIFPHKNALEEFSKERLSVIKYESDYLGKLFTSAYDGVGFKQVGFSYLYLRGTHSKKGLKSWPADILIFDEYDEMDPIGISMAEARERASPLKFKWRISTPVLPGKGVHALFLESDQRVWEVECPDCHRWQEMDFFRDVRVEGEAYEVWHTWSRERIEEAVAIIVACPSCSTALDRFAIGRWRPKQPEVTWLRGYHLPALAFPSVDLQKLCVKALSNDPSVIAELYRSDLGLPYDATGSRVTETMLSQLSVALDGGELPKGPWQQTTMGVDVGKVHHYRIDSTGPDGRRYVRALGTAKRWSELDTLMAQYQVRQCVIDAHPELHGARDWAIKHAGKVRRALYPNGLAGTLYRLVDAEQDERERAIVGTEKVHINRTMAMDAVYAELATVAVHWPERLHSDPEVKAHLMAPVRVETKDKAGQSIATWVHAGPDHFYHASVYCHIAYQTLPRAVASAPAAGGQRTTVHTYRPR